MDTYCAPLELNGRDVLALPSPEEGKSGDGRRFWFTAEFP